MVEAPLSVTRYYEPQGKHALSISNRSHLLARAQRDLICSYLKFIDAQELKSCDKLGRHFALPFTLLETIIARSETIISICTHGCCDSSTTILPPPCASMSWFRSTPPAQQKDPSQTDAGEYKPLDRNERTACWDARDTYFACLDQHGILDAIKDEAAAKKKCGPQGQAYERDCAASWVSTETFKYRISGII